MSTGNSDQGPECVQTLISVIDTATYMVVGTIPLPIGSTFFPGVASSVAGITVSPDGSKVYVSYWSETHYGMVEGGVLVINTPTSTVASTISVVSGQNPLWGFFPGVAVSPDGSKVYVPISEPFPVFMGGWGPGVAVIDIATGTVTAGIPISEGENISAGGLAMTPDGSTVYVTITETSGTGAATTSTVSMIDTATNTVVGSPIPVGVGASGLAVTPDGTKVYVVNSGNNTVSVIDAATNTVVAVLPVGNNPVAFGVFIQPRFAGTPGHRDCHRKSISKLEETFDGLKAAAIALGFPTEHALRTAVKAYCGL